MKKQTTIKLGRKEIKKFILSTGLVLPEHGWTIECHRACDGAIEDSFDISWEEEYFPSSRTFSLSADAISSEEWNEINGMQRIESIKHLRKLTDWSLKQALDYVDYFFPNKNLDSARSACYTKPWKN